MDKEITELSTRILNLKLEIDEEDEEDAQPKPGQENDIERVNENDRDKITKPKPDMVVTTNNDDIANPKPNLGVQKTLVPVNVPKKRVKRKSWTKLKSGLFGWKIMTEANTQKSDVAKPNKIHTQSKYRCQPNNLKPKHCPNESLNNSTLSKWLLTAKQDEGGGGKIRDN